MERESISDVLAMLCSWLLIPFFALFFFYLLLHQADGIVWFSLPLLALVFFIKRQAQKRY